jgi:hypothetical protein
MVPISRSRTVCHAQLPRGHFTPRAKCPKNAAGSAKVRPEGVWSVSKGGTNANLAPYACTVFEVTTTGAFTTLWVHGTRRQKRCAVLQSADSRRLERIESLPRVFLRLQPDFAVPRDKPSFITHSFHAVAYAHTMCPENATGAAKARPVGVWSTSKGCRVFFYGLNRTYNPKEEVCAANRHLNPCPAS